MEGQEKLVADLHQKIGDLTVDLEIFKKSPNNWASAPPPLVGGLRIELTRLWFRSRRRRSQKRRLR
jgi:hypothetical protein